MKDQCTPTPWKYVSEYDEAYIDGPEPSQKGMINFYLCDTAVGHANAAFIVRSVNAHEELLAALRSAHRALEYLADPDKDGLKCTGHSLMAQCIQDDIMEAIGKAEETT